MDHMLAREAESVVIGAGHENTSNIDLTVEDDCFVNQRPNGELTDL